MPQRAKQDFLDIPNGSQSDGTPAGKSCDIRLVYNNQLVA
jgi:hypothetical protein